VASGTRMSGGSEATGVGHKLAGQHETAAGGGAGMLERERREKMGFGLGCIFLTNQKST